MVESARRPRCGHETADFTVRRAKELHASTTGRPPVMTHDKKGDGISQELLEGKTVAAFLGIERLKIPIKFPDQDCPSDRRA